MALHHDQGWASFHSCWDGNANTSMQFLAPFDVIEFGKSHDPCDGAA